MRSDEVAVECLRAAYEQLLRTGGEDLAFADQPKSLPTDLVRDGELDVRAAKEMIRQLEAVRVYDSFAGVGTEPRANYLHRLATVRTRKGPYLADHLSALQGVLDEHLAAMREAAHLDTPRPVFVGVFPHGDLNARTRLIPDCGALILVNSGLMDLLWNVCKTNLASAHVRGEPPLLSDEQTLLVLTESFNDYLFGAGAHMVQQLPGLSDERAAYAATIVRYAEQFVAGHEIGHVVARHLDAGHPFAHDDIARENEADSIAAELVFALARAEIGGDPLHYLQLPVTGVVAFFSIALAVESLRIRATGAQPGETHPPTHHRVGRFCDRVLRRFNDDRLLVKANRFDQWLNGFVPSIGDVFAEVDSTMTRSGEFD